MNDQNPTLTKHQTVLTLHEVQNGRVPQVLFTQDNTEPGEHPESYWMNEQDFVDFGEPDTITLTVEAGDLLNDTPEDEPDEPLPLDNGDDDRTKLENQVKDGQDTTPAPAQTSSIQGVENVTG